MSKLNNVNLEKVKSTAEKGKQDPSTLRRTVKVEGEWRLDGDSPPQFVSTLQFEQGKTVVEIDSPSFLGGGGTRPGPIQFCLVGLASCFLSTYVTLAAGKGIQLRKASVAAECRINFSRTLGLSSDPIAEGVQFKVHAESDAPPDELRRLLKEAEQRCPAVYSLSNPVTVTSDLTPE